MNVLTEYTTTTEYSIIGVEEKRFVREISALSFNSKDRIRWYEVIGKEFVPVTAGIAAELEDTYNNLEND